MLIIANHQRNANKKQWEDFLGDTVDKNPPANVEDMGLGFHGQSSLASYSPWGRRVRHDWAIEPQREKATLVHGTLLVEM